MVVAALGLALVAFIAVLRLTGVVAIATDAVSAAREAARGLGDRSLDDEAKEALSRRAAGALFASFLKIAGIAALALGASLGLIWLGAGAGLYEFDAALDTAAGWPFLLGATGAATLGWIAADRLGRRRA